MRRTTSGAAVALGLVIAPALSAVLAGCSDEPAADDAAPVTSSPPTPTVPAGVSTTAPGTELAFGQSATLVWQPTMNLTGAVELSVESVAEQAPSVFEGWQVDDAMAASRPYFVSVSLANAGESDLAGQAVPLYLRDDNGGLGAPWTLGGDFTACQSGPLPTPFAPDATADLCLVYLAPDGAHVRDMVFEPTEGYDPIVWTGEVTPVEDEKG
jgi:hypothetical protein